MSPSAYWTAAKVAPGTPSRTLLAEGNPLAGAVVAVVAAKEAVLRRTTCFGVAAEASRSPQVSAGAENGPSGLTAQNRAALWPDPACAPPHNVDTFPQRGDN